MAADVGLERESARTRGPGLALAAALLFGASTPFTKLLLPGVDPLPLAGLLYLGSGAGLALLTLVRRRSSGAPASEKALRLRAADLPLLALIILFGGVVAPSLLLLGLERLSAVPASLLLALEPPFTMGLAVAFFGERLGRRGSVAAALVTVGALLVAWKPGPFEGTWIGAACVAGACLGWAIDNNLTRRLAHRDAVSLAQVKGWAAGALTLAIGLLAGQRVPPGTIVAGALLLGAISYGLSLTLLILAMRALGAARAAAWFACAPFVGALVAVPLLGESVGWSEVLGGGVLALGLGLFLRTPPPDPPPPAALPLPQPPESPPDAIA